jgi:hypothetical protein
VKKLILFATVSLTAIAAQFGCGGNPLPGQGGDQTGKVEQAAQPGGGGGGGSPAAGIAIGVQKVEGTPIAGVASQPGHDPLFPSPAEGDDPLPPSANTTAAIYVSPSGNDSGDGSQGKPFKTLNKAIHAAKAGTRITVLPGTYAEEIKIDASAPSGVDGQPIVLQAQGQVTLNPAGGSSSLMHVARAHWVIDGFEFDVRGQPKYAVSFEDGSQGSEITNSQLHDGSLGGGITTGPGSKDILIDNNEIFRFTRNDGHDSHGVVIQPGSKGITVRNNDIHDNGADSVQCLGPETFPEYNGVSPADTVLIEDNHLYNSRENAVDIKTCSNVTVKHNRMHTFHANAYAKDGTVIVIHMSAKNITVEGNEIYDAGKAIAIGGNHVGPVPSGVVIEKNLIHDMITGPDMQGIGIRLENSSGAKIQNNTFTQIAGPALMMGHGTGGATENLTVMNNVIDATTAVNLGSQAPGLKMDHNLYRAGAEFSGPKGKDNLAGWQKHGVDPSSKDVGSPVTDSHSLRADPSATDQGQDDGLKFCGAKIDIGAVESC